MRGNLSASRLSKARVVIPLHVVYRAFDQETVLLNLETGRYHGIDEIGGRIFAVLQESSSPERAASTLSEEYGRPFPEIAEDVARFCNELAERGLVEIEVDDG